MSKPYWDNQAPTVQLLGRWQPWHAGHLELFKRAHAKTGQVMVTVRDVGGTRDNPFDYIDVKNRIIENLSKEGFVHQRDFMISLVPNITEIVYGRDVGYAINKIELPEDIQQISATAIRKQMKEDGLL